MTSADELKRAILAGFAGSSCDASIQDVVSRGWSTITFTGDRHQLTLRIEGEGYASEADRWLADLGERDLDMHGHLLADIALLADQRDEDFSVARLSLEALTVEAAE